MELPHNFIENIKMENALQSCHTVNQRQPSGGTLKQSLDMYESMENLC